ncbi:MAG: oxidoreductase [Flavobacteriales bacterium]|nr:oxidoreductase [Flavobacteriales bacterium]
MAQQEDNIAFLSKFKLPGISIRAIEVTQENTLWFAGSQGRYGRVVNDKMEIDSISHEGRFPQFRSIASNGTFIYLLSIENPALLYKIDPTKPLGQYELVYQENDPKVFYDSLSFFDQNHGIAMGDPTDDCLSVIRTSDGGETWTKLSCEKLPKLVEGEAAFAASNSNIAVFKEKVWLVTGGTKARVFISENYGATWKVAETPLVQGGKMTGIFSVDFYDADNGVIMGGDWENKKNGKASKAISKDGGLTWNLVAENGLPGYISCVQFIPEEDAKKILAVSTEGVFYTEDKGASWKQISENGYYSLRLIDKNTAWVSTHEEIAKIKLNNL